MPSGHHEDNIESLRARNTTANRRIYRLRTTLHAVATILESRYALNREIRRSAARRIRNVLKEDEQ